MCLAACGPGSTDTRKCLDADEIGSKQLQDEEESPPAAGWTGMLHFLYSVILYCTVMYCILHVALFPQVQLTALFSLPHHRIFISVPCSAIAELFTIIVFVSIAVFPMGLALMYATYKWRESEEVIRWQEFSAGQFTQAAPRAQAHRVARAADAGLVLAAMGATESDMEVIPLTEEEDDGMPRANTGDEDEEEGGRGTGAGAGAGGGLGLEMGGEGGRKGIEHTSLLVGGEDGERRKAQSSSGGFRLRKGLEWNAGASWK